MNPELTVADHLVAQATYGLWDASAALSRLAGTDLQQQELDYLIRDASDVVEQLKRLQFDIIEDALDDLQAVLSEALQTEPAFDAVPF